MLLCSLLWLGATSDSDFARHVFGRHSPVMTLAAKVPTPNVAGLIKSATDAVGLHAPGLGPTAWTKPTAAAPPPTPPAPAPGLGPTAWTKPTAAAPPPTPPAPTTSVAAPLHVAVRAPVVTPPVADQKTLAVAPLHEIRPDSVMVELLAGIEAAREEHLSATIRAFRQGKLDWHDLVPQLPSTGNKDVDWQQLVDSEVHLMRWLSAHDSARQSDHGPLRNHATCRTMQDKCAIHSHLDCVRNSFCGWCRSANRCVDIRNLALPESKRPACAEPLVTKVMLLTLNQEPKQYFATHPPQQYPETFKSAPVLVPILFFFVLLLSSGLLRGVVWLRPHISAVSLS
jgi:hypothetical protein